MDKRIIFPTDEGGVAVMIPVLNNALNDSTEQWMPLKSMDDFLPPGFRLCTIEDIAAKDVPEGKPFKIIDVSELPETRDQREAWEYVD